MVNISKEYRVLCAHTALIAVEKLKEKVEGEAKEVVVPIASVDREQMHKREAEESKVKKK